MLLGGGEAGSPVKLVGGAGLIPRLRPQPSTTEEGGQSTEGLQSRCCQLQSELEKMRRQLSTEREEFLLKQGKMEDSLSAAHKTNQELEVSTQHTY